mgnify:CR=1 FL=1
MEVTINIKEQGKLLDFLNLIKDIDYIEVKNNPSDIPNEHKKILKKRLQKINAGEVNFNDWDEIKTNYESKAV